MSKECLEQVTTTSEASKKYGFHIRHIRQMCDWGVIDARISGNTWLISVESMQEFYDRATRNESV